MTSHKIQESWHKRFESGALEQELISRINERIKEHGGPTFDFFREARVFQEDSYNDMFNKDNGRLVAMTESTYRLPFKTTVKGVSVTKTKKDLIKTILQERNLSVYLNDKHVGHVDLRNKEILNANNKKIGRVRFLPFTSGGIFKELWHVYFDDVEKCSIVTSLPMNQTILTFNLKYRYDLVECYSSLTKVQKVFVLSMTPFRELNKSMRSREYDPFTPGEGSD